MDKKQLQDILSQPYQSQDWVKVLKDIFGVRNILQKPSPILLPSNKKAEAAFELGSFTTSDDRIIGLYLVKVKPEVWLERNKVGLRELLRSVYKYEVDGALIVFEQQDKWRLSFVSEIRSIDADGSTIKKITEPKRYTYLLGKGEKTKTPVTRLSLIGGKTISLEDIRNAFSVEALNEEFYKIVARHFYQLIGATEGKGTKEITHDRVLKLPSLNPNSHGAAKIYQEFAVRLIGRTVFCWFLKVKKSEAGISLLPEHLLSSDAVKRNDNYYHYILEKLFFQTLNTPMDARILALPNGCEQIPFLNGGLFEPQIDDYYKPNRKTGLSDNLNTLIIPDEWFRDFFENLEQYNFTIDENSVVDIEVSVDPEMLGRIFENLLAEIDPDSGETARKATGSFYTPREIVDYMATESLVHYLHNQTNIENESLYSIFKIDSEVSFSNTETEEILEALDRLKILDPACGSGAFPMGVLQKIVMALQKLDKNAGWWKARQISRIENVVLRKQVKEKLQQTTVEYARKIGIIQNSLYGVDIQPIAAEISKLRCFLTLIVDENIDENKPNRGVEPLPNLEFKFVTADALLKLPEEKDLGGLFNANEDLEELQQIRLDYLQSFGEHKSELKEQFENIRNKIAKQQIRLGKNVDLNSRAYKISSWNPFNHEKADWFDPLWMYGIKQFDIVVGNPPYINISNLKPDEYRNLLKSKFYTAKNKADTYAFFIERSFDFLNKDGLLSFIIPQTWKATDSFSNLREIIFKNHCLYKAVDLEFGVFAAIVKPMVVLILNEKRKSNYSISIYNDNLVEKIKIPISEILSNPALSINTHISEKQKEIFKRIEKGSIRLEQVVKFSRGIKTSNDERFILDNPKDKFCKPVYRGKNIKAYQMNWANEYIWYRPDLMKEKVGSVSYTKEFFEVPEKIVTQRINSSMQLLCAYDNNQNYFLDTTNVSRYDDWNRKVSLKYICALLNSRVINFWYCNTYLMPTIGLYELHSIPVKIAPSQSVFNNLVDYILLLTYLGDKNPINDYVPNSHIIQLFEEVINALVYELYFEEDFKNVKIAFMKYAERDFKSIKGLGKEQTIKTIHEAYQTLREKENEIRQNLKLMDTRLADLIMPIKTVK